MGPRLIVALDYASARAATEFTDRLTPAQCRLKIGMELFTHAGPSFVRDLTARGFDIFLDLKYHDIPNTVAAACRQAAHLGVWMLSVHVAGGLAMLRGARAAVADAKRRPLLVGITVLTSLSSQDLGEIGCDGDTAAQVDRLANLAHAAGLDGVVCAPTEVAALRECFGSRLILVTPGIRPVGAPSADQKRVLTPAQAVAAGADYLVIGRPITGADDPAAMLAAFNREIENASTPRTRNTGG